MATILKAAVLYVLLLFILRLIPRRTGNITTPFEFILLFLLGGIGMQAVIADDRSFTNALLGIFSIGLMHLLTATLKQRFDWLGRLIDGTPVVIVEKGTWHDERMHALRVQSQDVMAAARGQGVGRQEEIRHAIVERNGSVSIFKQSDAEEEQSDKDDIHAPWRARQS
jgi:uncharacterized membrane protein YcaP (DUF421 family)